MRRALPQACAHGIDAVAVDGFRVDTIFHVPPAFFDEFLFSAAAQTPGIECVAAASGHVGFLSFGEGFAAGWPCDDGAPAPQAGAHRLGGGPVDGPRIMDQARAPPLARGASGLG